MKLRIISFGFLFGVPQEASVLIDARCIRDPAAERGLRYKRGTDDEVKERVLANPITDHVLKYGSDLVSLRIQEGKQEFTLGIGCTSGHHRSVAVAEELARRMRLIGVQTIVKHKNINDE